LDTFLHVDCNSFSFERGFERVTASIALPSLIIIFLRLSLVMLQKKISSSFYFQRVK
jgi:hypothetical protein